jgi:hypothetical protein
MGKNLFDQYTLLHAAVGVIAYFWGFGFWTTIIIHTLFEIIENTNAGMLFINTYFKNVWPGGKPYADSMINNVGDSIGVAMGWLLSYYLDYLGTEMGWYSPHLAK